MLLPPPRARRILLPGPATLQLLTLLLLPLLLMRGFTGFMDFQTDDETVYYARGVEWLSGDFHDWNLAWSPLYSLWLGLLDGILPRSVHAMDASYLLVPMLAGVAIWWGLRGFAHSWVAFLLATWILTNGLVTGADLPRDVATPIMMNTMVNLFGMTLVCVSLGLISRGRYWAAVSVLLLTSFVRGEVGGILLVFGVLEILRHRRSPRALATIAVALALLGVVLFHADFRERSFFNYQQNWSRVEWIRHGKPDFTAGDSLFSVERFRNEYPESTTLFAAIAENPSASLAHLRTNAELLPSGLWDWIYAKGANTMPQLRAFLLAVMAALGVLVALRVLRRGAAPLRTGDARTWRFLCATGTVLPICVLMFPFGRFLMPVLPLILAVLASLGTWGGNALGRRVSELALGLGLPLATLLVFVLFPSPFAKEPLRHPPSGRTKAALLRSFELSTKHTVVTHRAWAWARASGNPRLEGRSLHWYAPRATQDWPQGLEAMQHDDPEILVLDRPTFEEGASCAPWLGVFLAEREWHRIALDTGLLVLIAKQRGAELESLARTLSAREDCRPGIRIVEASEEVTTPARREWQLSLEAGPHVAGRHFVLLASFRMFPGTKLGDTFVPLAPDPLTTLLLSVPNSLLDPTMGRLDDEGHVESRFRLPNDSPLLRAQLPPIEFVALLFPPDEGGAIETMGPARLRLK